MTTILNAIFGWAWIVMLVVLGVIVIVASLWKDEAPDRADENRDFSEAAMHNNKQGGLHTRTLGPSPNSFGR